MYKNKEKKMDGWESEFAPRPIPTQSVRNAFDEPRHDQREQSDKDLPTYESNNEGPVIKISLSDALRNKHERIVRRRYAETTMREYLEQLTDLELRQKYLAFYDAHPYFSQVCAGAKHHHHWIGGLAEHCCQMVGIMLDIRDLYRGDFEGRLTKDDCIVSVLLHDFAKIWTYEFITDEDRDRDPKKYKEEQTFKITTGAFNIIDEESKTLLELGRFGIVPTDQQWSAVLFHEAAFSKAAWGVNGMTRTMDTVNSRNPLAVLINMADMYSSQILGGSIA
jgi:hypothetical protein